MENVDIVKKDNKHNISNDLSYNKNFKVFTIDLNDFQTKTAKLNNKKFNPCIKVLRLSSIQTEITDNKENLHLLIAGTNHGQLLVINIISEKLIFCYNASILKIINSVDCISITKSIIYFIGFSDGLIQLVNNENNQVIIIILFNLINLFIILLVVRRVRSIQKYKNSIYWY